ncbi:MAG: NAD-dependent epimerase/dehydratase family protein [Candidatus Geothermarchaeales archaeon]
MERVLVTGGAGFIGSFTVDLLIEGGYEVTILDNLEQQVHRGETPEYLNKNATFVNGDVRDTELLKKIIVDADAVIHLAAVVGVGQSMYQLERYVDANTRGTSTLLDIIVNEENNVKKLVVASSMSIYGEGKYFCEACGEEKYPGLRSVEQLRNRVWEPLCPDCGGRLRPLPTDEGKPLMPTSIYAMTKRHQEEMCLLSGKTYGVPTVALRYFNAYGPRQSLGNPYTGVCAIFSSRILNDMPPYIFEDGEQRRDFVYVGDVAKANLLALERNAADYQAVNIGMGEATSIRRIADVLIDVYGVKVEPHVSQKYRKGDVRHCYADTSKARDLLGYAPSTSLEDGLRELAGWAREHEWGAKNLFETALRELRNRGLAE